MESLKISCAMNVFQLVIIFCNILLILLCFSHNEFNYCLNFVADLRISLLVGGDSMETQFEELAQSPDIIIATPGRLMHHLAEVDDMTLRTVEYVVFDEADCLFDMGFAEQLHKILAQLSENRQTLLFSATLPSVLAEFAKAGLRDPQLVRLDLDTKISPDLKLVFFTLRQEEKNAALLYLIREKISADQQSLIFVSTRHHVEFLNVLFREEGVEPSVCYGEMDQDARKIHISRFRARKTMFLIVTDVAARGIDIPLLDNVINWDFPPKPKIFVHRVGRAARAGRTGTAFSFVTSEDLPNLLDLHLFLSKPIRAAPTEEEVLLDKEGVFSKIDHAIASGETVYGRLPQTVIDLASDRIRETIDSSADLISLQKTCSNAFRMYSKSKPLPSKESIRRAKDLPREGLHPIFKNALEGGELMALAFSERLKTFRSMQLDYFPFLPKGFSFLQRFSFCLRNHDHKRNHDHNNCLFAPDPSRQYWRLKEKLSSQGIDRFVYSFCDFSSVALVKQLDNSH